VKRREFITLVGGVAAWPLAVRAQQPERMRRIGMLMNLVEDDPESRARMRAFKQTLPKLGWIDGRSVRIDIRWNAGTPANARKFAAEVVRLEPDVILASGSAALASLAELTRTIPIVFLLVPDPVGSGFIASLSQPGGNITGFLTFEFSLAAKWLEVLKEVAPAVKRAAILRDAGVASGIGQFAVIQSVRRSASR
jgi:putative tryptophan/tyrosine transport system substrate-binding protein